MLTNGIDPEVWLRHVLTHIFDHPASTIFCPETVLLSWPAERRFPAVWHESSRFLNIESRRHRDDAYGLYKTQGDSDCFRSQLQPFIR
jgi:hypothetical protein